MELPSADLGLDVGSLLFRGIEAGISEEIEAGAAKRGVMRGGSQGLFLDHNTITGQCHRAAYARMLGAEPPRSEEWTNKHLMFDSGHANEDSWVANLERSWGAAPGNLILREDEFPISWEISTDAGAHAVGSGREDIILCRRPEAGEVGISTPKHGVVIPVQAIELKQVSSINTAADVLFPLTGKPKLEHAIQAGRYIKQLGIPGQIWYTLPFVCPVPSWSFITPKIPQRGDPGSEHVDYGRDGKPSKIQPHVVGYYLYFHEEVLHYLRVGDEDAGWVPTIITADGLDDFWRMTLDTPGTRDLGPRPVAMDIHGEKGHYSPCDYCDWQSICDSHESDFNEWETAILDTVPEATNSKKEN